MARGFSFECSFWGNSEPPSLLLIIESVSIGTLGTMTLFLNVTLVFYQSSCERWTNPLVGVRLSDEPGFSRGWQHPNSSPLAEV